MAIGGFFLGAILGMVASFLLLRSVLRWPESSALVWSLLGAALCAVLMAYGMWRESHFRAVVTPERLELYRGQRKLQSFRRDRTVFSAKVTQQTTNGAKSGVIRELVVRNAKGEASYPLPGFGKDEFSMLINTLNPISGDNGLVRPEMRHQPVPTIIYPVDSATILKPLKRRQVIAITVELGAILLGGLVGALAGGRVSSALLGVVIGGALFAPVSVTMWITAQRKLKRVPQSLTVSAAGLVVDQQSFDPSSISRIEVMPPTYSFLDFEIRIFTDHEVKAYYLGTAAQRDAVFPRYIDFLYHLSHATINRPGMVQFDLG